MPRFRHVQNISCNDTSEARTEIIAIFELETISEVNGCIMPNFFFFYVSLLVPVGSMYDKILWLCLSFRGQDEATYQYSRSV